MNKQDKLNMIQEDFINCQKVLMAMVMKRVNRSC
jgi:hypothetical protein